MKKIFVLLSALVVVLGGIVIGYLTLSPKTVPKSDDSITILWAEWAPSESLKELVKDFTKETGITVKVETVPWNDFKNKAYSVFNAKGKDFDMVIGDSQWLGKGSRDGNYVELTDFVHANKVTESMHPVAVANYGEYPKGSGRYWAVPFEGDALGFAYRKDLFEDPKEKAAFKAAYGYELEVPKTWNEVRDIAEFFYRPESKFYGIGVLTGVDSDPLTMGVDNLIWDWGGALGDEKTHKVEGILNSKQSIAGLEFYKQLYQFAPPHNENTFYTDIQDEFKKGEIPMFFSYFAFFPDLEDPASNPHYKDTGYFQMPKGPAAQVASLGGQGLSINSYSTKKDQSLVFMKWFIKEDVQKKWSALGGFSVNKNVLASKEFLTEGARFNPVFAESMNMLRDFWSDPVYADLLTASQTKWSKFLTTNDLTAQETMDSLAKEWENIFETNGYYRE